MHRNQLRELTKKDCALSTAGALGFAMAAGIAVQAAGIFGVILVFGLAVAGILAMSQLNLRKAYRSIDSLRSAHGHLAQNLKQLEPLAQQMDIVLCGAMQPEAASTEDPVARARALRPPSIIPQELQNQYTMNGRADVEHWYFNDSQPTGTSVVFTAAMIASFLTRISRRESVAYGETSVWLYDALTLHSIQNMEVAVMGSVSPHFESVCLAFGGHPTTIEYSTIVSEDPRVVVVTVDEFWQSPRTFDAAFSISSFEHDGLGRYGDPLNPVGDLEAMQKMKTIVKPGGLLYLAIPVGRDRLVWNAHRIYGKARLPMLLEGWKVVGRFGWTKDNDEMYPEHSQPVIVLENIA